MPAESAVAPPNHTSSGPVPVTVHTPPFDGRSNKTRDQRTPSKCQTCSAAVPTAQMSLAQDPHKAGPPFLNVVTVESRCHEMPSKCAMSVGLATQTSLSELPQIECQKLIDAKPADALCQAAPVQRSTPGESTPLTRQNPAAQASCDGETQMSATPTKPPVNESGGVLSVQEEPSQ